MKIQSLVLKGTTKSIFLVADLSGEKVEWRLISVITDPLRDKDSNIDLNITPQEAQLLLNMPDKIIR